MQSQSQEEDQIQAWMHGGQYPQALALLDAQLQARPGDASLHWRRCQCLVQLQQVPEARQAVDHVLHLHRNFVPALMLRIKLARDLAEDFDAEPLLRRVLKHEPGRARAQYWLAELLLDAESDSETPRQQEALALLNQCIATAPMLLRARLLRADYYWNHYYEALEQEQTKPSDNVSCSPLEAALADYAWVSAHAQSHYAALRAAKALVRLERDTEALVYLDVLMAQLPQAQPLRHTVVQLHKRVSKRIRDVSSTANSPPPAQP